MVDIYSSDIGLGMDSGMMEVRLGRSWYGGLAGRTVVHNFDLSDYLAFVVSTADGDAEVGEIYIDSIDVDSFIFYNSGRGESGVAWTIPYILSEDGASVFAGPGGQTIAHTKGDITYVPCIIPSANGSGEIGEWWVTDIANTSFVVRNSGSGLTAFKWAMPQYGGGRKGASSFDGSGGVTITHNINISRDYTPLIVPTANPEGHLGAVYVTDITPNSFVVRNTGNAVTSFMWIIPNESATEILATQLETETGVCVDAIVEQLAAILKSDQGMGVDTITKLLGFLFESDVGTGVDTITKLLGFLFESDVGTGVEALVDLLITIRSSDVGAGVENQERAIFIYLLIKLLQKKGVNIEMSQRGKI